MSDDYYHILEVGRNATKDEIRQAYRRLALKLHPDKNPQGRDVAEARFKLVSEAYDVLSNEDKRLQYDQHGSSAFSAPQPEAEEDQGCPIKGGAYAFTFRDPEELFRDFFRKAGSTLLEELFGEGGAQPKRGATILTGGRPFSQQSFDGSERSGFLYHADDVLFAAHVPGGMGVMPGLMGTPTQQMSSTWYEGSKRIETHTILDEAGKRVLRYEDGVPVSFEVKGKVYSVTRAGASGSAASSSHSMAVLERLDSDASCPFTRRATVQSTAGPASDGRQKEPRSAVGARRAPKKGRSTKPREPAGKPALTFVPEETLATSPKPPPKK
ncbi:dnaJ homolog subfamily B member 6-like [Haemaphysalis longicornis]|uniref:J domain-containing protein n=1 Tax=Haemaphysalis longicornis TaxID=44386 RepID=A0A9J6GE49_HAELO|nr:hypothetical protein HPB48_018633 [Haemaphysalis longicornis]